MKNEMDILLDTLLNLYDLEETHEDQLQGFLENRRAYEKEHSMEDYFTEYDRIETRLNHTRKSLVLIKDLIHNHTV